MVPQGLTDKEHYRSSEALREILNRVRALCHEDATQALAAAKSAQEILTRRLVEPPPDLAGLTQAVYATTLRCNGRFEEALEVYEQALNSGNPEKAASTLRPAVAGLRRRSPDEALDASVDLMCILAKLGKTRESAEEALRGLALTSEVTIKPSHSAGQVA